jgi:anti-anti-sigma regulatory factor
LPAGIDTANADRVGADLQAAFAPGVTTVVADMTATTFCDSRGIHALVMAHQRAGRSTLDTHGLVKCSVIFSKTLVIS